MRDVASGFRRDTVPREGDSIGDWKRAACERYAGVPVGRPARRARAHHGERALGALRTRSRTASSMLATLGAGFERPAGPGWSEGPSAALLLLSRRPSASSSRLAGDPSSCAIHLRSARTTLQVARASEEALGGADDELERLRRERAVREGDAVELFTDEGVGGRIGVVAI